MWMGLETSDAMQQHLVQAQATRAIEVPGPRDGHIVVKMWRVPPGELGFVGSWTAGPVLVFPLNRISAGGSTPLFAFVFKRDSAFDESQQTQNPLVISLTAVEEELSCSAELCNGPTALHESLSGIIAHVTDIEMVHPCQKVIARTRMAGYAFDYL
jgi:hypothetical protein